MNRTEFMTTDNRPDFCWRHVQVSPSRQNSVVLCCLLFSFSLFSLFLFCQFSCVTQAPRRPSCRVAASAPPPRCPVSSQIRRWQEYSSVGHPADSASATRRAPLISDAAPPGMRRAISDALGRICRRCRRRCSGDGAAAAAPLTRKLVSPR